MANKLGFIQSVIDDTVKNTLLTCGNFFALQPDFCSCTHAHREIRIRMLGRRRAALVHGKLEAGREMIRLLGSRWDRAPHLEHYKQMHRVIELLKLTTALPVANQRLVHHHSIQ
jgi:hypothetical protein